MTTEQMTQYKKNHIDNQILEYACRTNREPSIFAIKKWSREADARLAQMAQNLSKVN